MYGYGWIGPPWRHTQAYLDKIQLTHDIWMVQPLNNFMWRCYYIVGVAAAEEFKIFSNMALEQQRHSYVCVCYN